MNRRKNRKELCRRTGTKNPEKKPKKTLKKKLRTITGKRPK